jgi:predicted outer membrane protein
MDAHLAACLLLGNQKEIAISKFAMEHAQNQKVKQFAQQMIASHSKDAAELQKFVGPEVLPPLDGQAIDSSGSAATIRQRSTTTSTSSTAQDQDRSRDATSRSTASSDSRARGGEQARSATTPSSQPGAQPGQAAQSSQPGQSQLGQSQPGQSQPGQSRTDTLTTQSRETLTTQREVPVSASVGSYDHAQMATQRMKIEHEVAKQCLQLMKAQLQKYSGEKFDQAYLGQQAGEHVQMIAMLTVFENQASPELKQLITKAKGEAQDHLRTANELMEEVHQPGAASSRTNPNPGSNR